MSLRDDLLGVVDGGRLLADTLGLRQRTVATCLIEWSGNIAGRGTATHTITPIVPTPKVREPPGRLVAEAGGKFIEGDLQITKISATLTDDDLTGGTLATGTEWAILVDGFPYRVVGAPTRKNFAAELLVRRMTGRAVIVAD